MSVEDIPAVRDFPRMHHAIDGAMRRQLGLRAAQHRLKRKALALQYRALFEQWQSRCAGVLLSFPTDPCMALGSSLLSYTAQFRQIMQSAERPAEPL